MDMSRKSKGSSARAADASDLDAIALLVADHKRVARLFAEFDALKDQGGNDEKARIVARICEELTAHTAIEEELFYPAAGNAIHDDELMDKAWVEHAGAKNLVAQLRAAQPEDDWYDAKVTVLGEQIDHHVQEEEKDMFPRIRRSGVDTMALGAILIARKAKLMAAPAPAKALPTAGENKKAGTTKKKRRSS